MSHSSLDWREAVALKQWLAEQDPPLANEIFLDLDRDTGIKTGTRWKEALLRANSRCEAVVCLLSTNWEASDECRIEYRTAENLYKQIFCARLEPSSGEYLTSDWQRCDLFGDGSKTEIDIGDGRPVSFATEGLFRLRDGIRGAGIGAESFVWPPPADPNRAPYRGWEAFSEVDAGVFFGRDAQIVLALDALRGMRQSAVRRLFVVLGPSGSGKSSFLRAGLLPRLRRDDRRFLLLDIVRPERNPLTGESGMAHAIHATRQRLGLRQPTLGEIKSVCGDAGRVRELLLECQLAAATRLLDHPAEDPSTTLILPLDQAEELFSADATTQASQFLTLISDLAGGDAHPGLGLIVAATIRTDRYEIMQTAPELANLETHVFDDLKPMPATQFKEVVTGPAARATEGGHPLKLEPRLVARLLDDCSEGADTLPMLSLTLARLYRDYGSGGELTAVQYEAMGGMAHVVQTEVDELLSPDPQQRAAQLALLRRAFIPWLATISPDNDQPMRRVARYTDLPQDSRELIDAFVAKRLMVRDERDGEVVVEVALESLLRQWDELDRWLREQRDDLKEADNLERGAAAWEKNARDDSWLLQGTRLVDAEKLAITAGFSERLAPVRDYLAASRQREDDRREAEQQRQEADLRNAREHATILRKRARVLRAVLAVAVVIALVAVLAFLQAFLAKREADARTREATALRLVSEAQAMLGDVRPGGDVRAFQQLLAAHAIAGAAVDGALLEALSKRLSTLKIIDTGTKVNGVAVSPDGRRVAAADADHSVRIFDLDTGQPVGQPLVGHEGDVLGVAFSPDGHRLASAGADKTIRLWNADTGEPDGQPLTGHSGQVLGVAFSPDGHRLASAGADKTIRLWNADTGEPDGQPLTGHQAGVSGVAFSPDGHRLVSGSWDRTVRVWDIDTRQPVGPLFTGHDRQVLSVAFSPTGRQIASGGADMTMRLWSAETGSAGWDAAAIVAEAFDDVFGPTSAQQRSPVWSVAVGHDGHRLAGAGDKTIRLGYLDGLQAPLGPTLKEQKTLTGHQDRVTGVAFRADDLSFASGSWDHTVRLWNAAAHELATGSAVYSVAFSPDGHRIATAGFGKSARLWNADTGESIGNLNGHESSITSVTFSPDGHRIATAGFDRSIRLWNADTGQAIGRWIASPRGGVTAIAFSPDGHRIATAAEDKTVRIWNADTGQPIGQPLTGHQDKVRAVAFSPDGHRLASAGNDETVRLWNADTGESIDQPLAGHDGAVYRVVFSPDGRVLASAGADRTIRRWNADTGEPIGDPLIGHQDDVLTVAFSPDGHRLASGGLDKTVRLWSADTGQPVGAPLAGHTGPVWSVAFNPDGLSVASGSEDWSVRLWPAVATPEMLCEKLSQNMSRMQWNQWVSADIKYVEVCPGLPVRPDDP